MYDDQMIQQYSGIKLIIILDSMWCQIILHLTSCDIPDEFTIYKSFL